jgi:predicted AAA+ superfamily ATPase
VETFQEVRSQPDSWGRMVESAIGAYLINSSFSTGFQLYYWREGNYEVDFVLEYRGKVIGIEIKSGHAQTTSGMQVFQKTQKPDQVLLVGDSSLPWQEFLQLNISTLF